MPSVRFDSVKPVETGDVFEFPYPFIRQTYYYMDEEGDHEVPSWRPGVRFEQDGDGVADGLGRQVLSVVGSYKPSGRYSERVFFTRKWVDPAGNSFGKKTLRIMGIAGFRNLTGGYRHEFDLVALKPGASK